MCATAKPARWSIVFTRPGKVTLGPSFMKFESYFRAASYATILAAAAALLVAGGVGLWLSLAFAIALAVAWKLEGTRWQLSERLALLVIILSLPVFYLDWRILTPFLESQ